MGAKMVVNMNAKTAYSLLIESAAELAGQTFMPSNDKYDYDVMSMSVTSIIKMLDSPRENLRLIALNVRQGADAQAAEIKILRDAIKQTLNENAHLADGDNCTLIHLVRAIETPNELS